MHDGASSLSKMVSGDRQLYTCKGVAKDNETDLVLKNCLFDFDFEEILQHTMNKAKSKNK